MWNIVAFSIIVSGCSVSPYCVLGTLFLCVLSVGSPLVNCIQLSTCRLVFTLATFLSAQCRLILFLIRVLSLFVKVIQLRVRGLWVLRIYILSISGGVLSSNWSLCLKLPLCLLILELDASNYRLVHTLNYRRFFFLLPGPVFLSNCDRDLPFQSRVTFSCIYWTMNLILNWLVQLFLVHHSCLLLI